MQCNKTYKYGTVIKQKAAFVRRCMFYIFFKEYTVKTSVKLSPVNVKLTVSVQFRGQYQMS